MDSAEFRANLRKRPIGRMKGQKLGQRSIVQVQKFASVMSVSIVDESKIMHVLNANEDCDEVFVMGEATYVMGCSATETHTRYVNHTEETGTGEIIFIQQFEDAFENARK